MCGRYTCVSVCVRVCVCVDVLLLDPTTSHGALWENRKKKTKRYETWENEKKKHETQISGGEGRRAERQGGSAASRIVENTGEERRSEFIHSKSNTHKKRKWEKEKATCNLSLPLAERCQHKKKKGEEIEMRRERKTVVDWFSFCCALHVFLPFFRLW